MRFGQGPSEFSLFISKDCSAEGSVIFNEQLIQRGTYIFHYFVTYFYVIFIFTKAKNYNFQE